MPPENPRTDTTSEIRRNLDKPLIPQLVSVREDEDGYGYQYLPVHAVITQANRLFGHGNWSTQIREHKPLADHNGQIIGYSCIARVSIPALNACYEGYGFNPLATRSDGRIRDTAQAHDMAAKGAESDAIKRAFRYLGDRFGNSLYEKSSERAPLARFAFRAWKKRLGDSKQAWQKVLGPYEEPEDVPISFSLNSFYEAVAAPATAAVPDEAAPEPEPPETEPAEDDFPPYPGDADADDLTKDPFDPDNPFG